MSDSLETSISFFETMVSCESFGVAGSLKDEVLPLSGSSLVY